MGHYTKQYLVRARDVFANEDIHYMVHVDERIPKAEVLKKFEIAKNYIFDIDEYNLDKYDEHLEDMKAFREEHSGDKTFIHYLEKYCHYEVIRINAAFDFTFEW